MHTRKNWKQQLTTALSLTLITMAIATGGSQQTLAQQRLRQSAATHFPQRNQATGTYATSVGPNVRRSKNAAPGYQSSDLVGSARNNLPHNSKAGQHHRLTGAEGSYWPTLVPQVKSPGSASQKFDRGYLPPFALSEVGATIPVKPGQRTNLTVNSGGGNDRFGVRGTKRPTAQPSPVVGDWNGDGAPIIGHRRKLFGSTEYFNGQSKPKKNLTGASTTGFIAGAHANPGR